jgi:hypothetical protein
MGIRGHFMVRWVWRAAIAIAALLLAGDLAIASDPTAYSFVTEHKGEQPQVRLNGVVRIQVDGTDVVDPSKAQLFLKGLALGVKPEWLADGRQLSFTLQRTKDNRALWSELLGAPFGKDPIQSVLIHVDYAGNPLAFRKDIAVVEGASQTSAGEIRLVIYDTGWMALGLFATAAVTMAIAVWCWKTTMMRDGPIPQMLKLDRPYSLGRFQMAVWFCLVFASFIFIFVTTRDLGSITPQTFILLGISGATALGSIAIEQSKDSPATMVENALSGFGLKTRADVEKVSNAIVSNKAGNAASTVIPDVTLPGIPNPTVGDLWAAYEAKIADYKTGGFLKDLVTDVNGPTIHRWQILIWTLTLGFIYVCWTYTDLETPIFDTNLLALMGISSGVYLGFKIPERQANPT